MKKTIILAVTCLWAMACSEHSLEKYHGDSFIQFGPDPKYVYDSYNKLRDTLKSYLFFYEPTSEKQVDVYFDIYALGGSKNFDRSFTLQQITVAGDDNAMPGVNYVAFDAPQMKQLYSMKAGTAWMKVPIRIIKPSDNDPKLYTLKFRLVPNENFKLGETELLWRTLTFTTQQQKPSFWNSSVEDYTFGKYSRVKHSFMINFSKLKWDDTTWAVISKDEGLVEYWKVAFAKELIRVNAERVAAKQEKLTDESGELVEFP